MLMIRYLSVAAALAVGATIAVAQSGGAAIDARKEAMKAIAGANKGLGAMNKGEAPFEAAKAAAAFKVMEENLVKSKTLYPDDTKTGNTDAMPAVWEKKADFTGKFDKAVADVKAAAAASKDDASFKDEYKKVVSNCGGCHKDYRKPQQK